MSEAIVAIIGAFVCAMCFFFGETLQEKKDLKNEVKTISKGAAAGDAAVSAYRMRKKK